MGKKEIVNSLKQAQKDQNQPEQMRLYQLLAEEYRKEKDYINAVAIYNFALALCNQEKDEEAASKIKEILAEIEIEFLQQIQVTNIDKSEAAITLFSSRNQQHKSDIKQIRELTEIEIGKCHLSTSAPHKAPLNQLIDKYKFVETIDDPNPIKIIDLFEDGKLKDDHRLEVPIFIELNVLGQLKYCKIESRDNLKEKLKDLYQINNIKSEILSAITTPASTNITAIIPIPPKTTNNSSTIQQTYQTTSQELRNFIQNLITECKSDLSKIGLELPPNFHYAIICFGSLARDEATPYSDLEFGILIDDESDNKDYSLKQKEQRKEQAKEYFRNLTKLLNIKTINLGETTITIQDIEELRGLPSPTKNGFSFDGNTKGSCKTPLGNIHINDIKAEEQYELICTPQEMAQFHNQEWYLRDNHFSTVLSSSAIIEGHDADKLLRDYDTLSDEALSKPVPSIRHQKKIITAKQEELLTEEERTQRAIELSFLPEEVTLREQRAFLLLQEAVERFAPRAGRLQEESKRTFSAKYDFYRMPVILINHLAYLQNIKHTIDRPGISIWDKFNQLFVGNQKTQPKFPMHNQEGMENLRWMIDRVLQIRLKAYLDKGAQDEDMLVLDEYDEKTRNQLVEQGFGISLNEVYEVYYVMIPFNSIMEYLIDAQKIEDTSFSQENFYSFDPYIKGFISNLFLDYGQAIKHYQEALRQSLFSKTGILNHLGNALWASSHYSQAIKCHQTALKIKERMYGGHNHQSVADSLSSLGCVYYSRGEYEEAREKFEEALKITEEIYGSHNHQSVADSLHNLGCTHGKLCNYKEQMKFLYRALEMYKAVFGYNHPSVAITLNSLGDAYYSRGEYEEAKNKFEEALKINERIFGCNHLFVAKNLNNLGIIYGKLKNYNQEKELLERSLRIMEAIFSDNHPSIAECLNGLGNVYGELGDHNKQIEILNRALKIFNPNHPNFSAILNSLGIAYGKLGNYAKQIEILNRSLKVIKIDSGDPLVIIHLKNLGNAHFYLGEIDKAMEFFQKAENIYRSLDLVEHPDYEIIVGAIELCYTSLGNNAFLAGDEKKAKEFYSKSSLPKIVREYSYEKLSDPEYQLVLGSHFYKDSKQLFLAIEHYEILKQKLGVHKPGIYNKLSYMYHIAATRMEGYDEERRSKYLTKAEKGFADSMVLNSTSGNNTEYAILLIKGDKLTKAIRYLERATTLSTDKQELEYGRLEITILIDELRKHLEDKLVKNPQAKISIQASHLAYYLLIKYSQINHDTLSKLEEFSKKVIDHRPKNSVSYFLLAKSYQIVGKEKEFEHYSRDAETLRIQEKMQEQTQLFKAQQKMSNRQYYQISYKNSDDYENKKKLIIGNGELLMHHDMSDGSGVLLARIDPMVLTKDLRGHIGLFKAKINDIDDQKLQELMDYFPTITIERDPENQELQKPKGLILITADINLKTDIDSLVRSWSNKPNPSNSPSPESLGGIKTHFK